MAQGHPVAGHLAVSGRAGPSACSNTRPESGSYTHAAQHSPPFLWLSLRHQRCHAMRVVAVSVEVVVRARDWEAPAVVAAMAPALAMAAAASMVVAAAVDSMAPAMVVAAQRFARSIGPAAAAAMIAAAGADMVQSLPAAAAMIAAFRPAAAAEEADRLD